MTGPVLNTERLILRPIAMEDFPRWAEMMADPEASRFLGGVQPPATAWRGFMTMAGAWSLTGVSMFSVIERDTGLWLGRIGPWRPEGWPGNEVGWGLHPDAQGKGYGVEAAIATLDYAFDVLGWEDVIHCSTRTTPFAAAGRAGGIAQSGADTPAAALRGRIRGRLGAEPGQLEVPPAPLNLR